jgi:hypothetical protein
MKFAEAAAHLRLQGSELSLDLVHIDAARSQLGFDLRVVGAKA